MQRREETLTWFTLEFKWQSVPNKFIVLKKSSITSSDNGVSNEQWTKITFLGEGRHSLSKWDGGKEGRAMFQQLGMLPCANEKTEVYKSMFGRHT